jgi:hypothetical protein
MRLDQYLCRPCRAAGRLEAATSVDHIEHATEENFFDLANLRAVCRLCQRANQRGPRSGYTPMQKVMGVGTPATTPLLPPRKCSGHEDNDASGCWRCRRCYAHPDAESCSRCMTP